jgi:hypothetical protein
MGMDAETPHGNAVDELREKIARIEGAVSVLSVELAKPERTWSSAVVVSAVFIRNDPCVVSAYASARYTGSPL